MATNITRLLLSLHLPTASRPIVDLPLLRRTPKATVAPPKFFGAGAVRSRPLNSSSARWSPKMAAGLGESSVTSDLFAFAVTGAIALFVLRFWEETAKRGIDQKLNRKLVHVSVGLVFMLCWPMFSSGLQGAVLASLIPAVNIIKMLLLGLGIWKDDATVKSMSRYGDHRELLRGPLYYALAVTLSTVIYWRTSPIGIATICNLCAGDGLADVVGRRLGGTKLPYNKNKSFAGSIAMAIAGFLASVGFTHYFSTFGFIQESRDMVFSFLAVSLITTVVESLPISTELDDNLTVPVASLIVGTIFF